MVKIELPQLQADSDVKLNIYIDHSLIEIFVNDGVKCINWSLLR